MVIESQNDYDSLWAAISSIAPKIGCTPETLCIRLRQYEESIKKCGAITEWPASWG